MISTIEKKKVGKCSGKCCAETDSGYWIKIAWRHKDTHTQLSMVSLPSVTSRATRRRAVRGAGERPIRTRPSTSLSCQGLARSGRPERRGALLRLRTQAAQASTSMPAPLKGLIAAFSAVPDPMLRYKQLLHFAEKLEPLSAEHHTPENKVEGCVSQVWVRGTLQGDGTVAFEAESDSQLTKGLAALLVRGLSGATPDAITALDPSFIEDLGLQQSLTPSRNNGFLNMLLKMQKIAQGLGEGGEGVDPNLPMSQKIEQLLRKEFEPSR